MMSMIHPNMAKYSKIRHFAFYFFPEITILVIELTLTFSPIYGAVLAEILTDSAPNQPAGCRCALCNGV